jgi:hypothetical protein
MKITIGVGSFSAMLSFFVCVSESSYIGCRVKSRCSTIFRYFSLTLPAEMLILCGFRYPTNTIPWCFSRRRNLFLSLGIILLPQFLDEFFPDTENNRWGIFNYQESRYQYVFPEVECKAWEACFGDQIKV